MKHNKFISFILLLVLIAFFVSSCSVTYRERHPRYREREKVIVTYPTSQLHIAQPIDKLLLCS